MAFTDQPMDFRAGSGVRGALPVRKVRRQLSLYAPADAARDIERVRAIVDPVQSSLIPAHVTLCREDELSGAAGSGFRARLANDGFEPVALTFGAPVNFFSHGWLLPCTKGEEAFRGLRERLLGAKGIMHPKPHITLAHPRNPKAVGNNPAQVSSLPAGIGIVFPTIFLIEQEGEAPWRVLESYRLSA